MHVQLKTGRKITRDETEEQELGYQNINEDKNR